MKVTASIAITPNGFIATPEGAAGFVSRAYVERMHARAKAAGNILIGRGAYDALIEAKAFPLPGVTNIVMTSHPPADDSLKNIVFTDKTPEEVLEDLKADGVEEVFLAGGGEILGSFMADGLVDEFYLAIHPFVFGEGIRVFGYSEFERQLELLETARFEHEVELHYAVRKYTVDDVVGDEEA